MDELRKGPVDLLDLIKEQCSSGLLQELALEDLSITATVLTGGSCRWLFMLEMIQEAFPVLLKMPASNERLEKAQNTFQSDMEQALLELFFENEYKLETELEVSIGTLVAKLAQTIPVTAVMDTQTSKPHKTS